MAVMTDLKEAIENVLLLVETTDDGRYIIDFMPLYNLQQEYNIHFVEPNDTQITWIEK